MNLTEAMQIIRALRERKRQISIDADGCDDRFYLIEREWEAIWELLEACEGEF